MNSMKTMQTAVDEIIKSVKYMIDNALNKTTKSYEAIIQRRNTDGTYEVKFNGNSHNLKAFCDYLIPNNTLVKVIVPQGNMSIAYILPPVSKGGEIGDIVTSVNRRTGAVVLNQNDVGGSNNNLYINPWFTVNQRGAKTFTHDGGSTYSYGTVDRWRVRNAVATVNDDGSLTISKIDSSQIADLSQTIEPSVRSYIVGKTVTMSALMQDGTLLTQTFVCPDTTTVVKAELPLAFVVLVNSAGMHFNYRVISTDGVANIKAVKLELGSVSTLANDSPPNYVEELEKCQYRAFALQSTGGGRYVGNGAATSTTNARIFIPTPVSLATDKTPTLSFDFDISAVHLRGNGASIDPTAISLVGITTNGVSINVTASGLTTNQIYTLFFNTDLTTRLLISVDL